MEGDQNEMKKASAKLGAQIHDAKAQELQNIAKNAVKKGLSPKEVLGLNDSMVEGIYGQAYRLYNTGRYKDASQIFRMLIMINAAEPKYTMGLAACLHMMKDYPQAVKLYTVCGLLDPNNPIPYYHASDCYLQMNDQTSALISLEMAVKRAGEKPEYQTLKDRALMTIESLKKELQAKK